MKSLMVVTQLNDPFFMDHDSEFSEYTISKAKSSGLLQADADTSDLDANLVMQLFSPLFMSQRLLIDQTKEPCSSIVCPDGFVLAFRHADDLLFIAMNGDGTESETFLHRKLQLFITTMHFIFGPSGDELGHSQSGNKKSKWNFLRLMMQSWSDLVQTEQAFLVEAIERVHVNQMVNEKCMEILLKSIKQFQLVRDQPVHHAMLLVNSKLLALYSVRGAPELNPKDVLMIIMLLRTMYPQADRLEDLFPTFHASAQHPSQAKGDDNSDGGEDEYHSAPNTPKSNRSSSPVFEQVPGPAPGEDQPVGVNKLQSSGREEDQPVGVNKLQSSGREEDQPVQNKEDKSNQTMKDQSNWTQENQSVQSKEDHSDQTSEDQLAQPEEDLSDSASEKAACKMTLIDMYKEKFPNEVFLTSDTNKTPLSSDHDVSTFVPTHTDNDEKTATDYINGTNSVLSPEGAPLSHQNEETTYSNHLINETVPHFGEIVTGESNAALIIQHSGEASNSENGQDSLTILKVDPLKDQGSISLINQKDCENRGDDSNICEASVKNDLLIDKNEKIVQAQPAPDAAQTKNLVSEEHSALSDSGDKLTIQKIKQDSSITEIPAAQPENIIHNTAISRKITITGGPRSLLHDSGSAVVRSNEDSNVLRAVRSTVESSSTHEGLSHLSTGSTFEAFSHLSTPSYTWQAGDIYKPQTVFLETTLCSYSPYNLHSVQVAPGLTLVIVSQAARQSLADALYQVIQTVQDIVHGRRSKLPRTRSLYVYDTIHIHLTRLQSNLKKSKPSLRGLSREIFYRWDKEEFKLRLLSFLEKDIFIRIPPELESPLVELSKKLRELFSDLYLAAPATSSQLLEALNHIRDLVNSDLTDYREYLNVKAQRNITMTSYIHDFPGLIHFIFVDRRHHWVTAPSLNISLQGGDSMDATSYLKDKIWRMHQLMMEKLTEGYTTIIMKDGDFYFSYFLWFEDYTGNSLPVMESYKPLFKKTYPGILCGTLYREIIQSCFPHAIQGNVHCNEMFLMHVGAVHPVYIAAHCRKLAYRMWEMSSEYHHSTSLL